MLATHGLAEALRVESSHGAIPVDIAADHVGKGEPHIELAVYLCCLESIQNAAKHAGEGASVTVRLQRDGHRLRFSVADTGVGFDPATTLPGAATASSRSTRARQGSRAVRPVLTGSCNHR
jgi:signal transduction histidine kinase